MKRTQTWVCESAESHMPSILILSAGTQFSVMSFPKDRLEEATE